MKVIVSEPLTFAVKSAMLPFDIIDFAILPAQRSLAGNSGIGRCHVVST